MNFETAKKFFYENAGYCYDPKTETPDQGRERCAHEHAAAEEWARTTGCSFAWDVDRHYVESKDLRGSGIEHDGPLWVCIMRDEHGEACDSLGGVDFGPDGEPWGDPYRRVCEAEMALEAMARIRTSVSK